MMVALFLSLCFAAVTFWVSALAPFLRVHAHLSTCEPDAEAPFRPFQEIHGDTSHPCHYDFRHALVSYTGFLVCIIAGNAISHIMLPLKP